MINSFQNTPACDSDSYDQNSGYIK